MMVWMFSKPYFCRKECHAKDFCVRKNSVDTLHFANVIFKFGIAFIFLNLFFKILQCRGRSGLFMGCKVRCL